MKLIWALVGRGLFWLSWPALRVYMGRGERSRVIVVAEDRLLLVKGFVGHGLWTLPGGGIKRAETARQGAVREVWEETGLKLPPASLRTVGRGVASECGLKFSYVVFAVELPKTARLIRQKRELTDAAWLPLSTMARRADISPATRRILALWRPATVCYTLHGR